MKNRITRRTNKNSVWKLSGFILFFCMGVLEIQAEQVSRQVTEMNTILKRDLAAEYLHQFSPQARDILSREIYAPEFAGVIPNELVTELLAMQDGNPGSIQDLMIKLLPVASQYALPPISNFRVGAVSQGASGALYLGANLEIAGAALGFAVHAEQSAVNNALLHNEKGIKRIAVTAAPCGHCRQFLNELHTAADLEIIVIGQKSISLTSLLPESFGPADLGVKKALLAKVSPTLQCKSDMNDQAVCLGSEVAQHSYAPYSGSPSSVVLKVDGELFAGAYIENAAFNPSLPPLLSALDRLRFQETDFSKIQEVVLIELREASISQVSYTQAVVSEIAPSAKLRVEKIDKTETMWSKRIYK